MLDDFIIQYPNVQGVSLFLCVFGAVLAVALGIAALLSFSVNKKLKSQIKRSVFAKTYIEGISEQRKRVEMTHTAPVLLKPLREGSRGKLLEVYFEIEDEFTI